MAGPAESVQVALGVFQTTCQMPPAAAFADTVKAPVLLVVAVFRTDQVLPWYGRNSSMTRVFLTGCQALVDPWYWTCPVKLTVAFLATAVWFGLPR
ncbi:hypothetical protein EDD99_0041 [Streptomyces sp. 846.5]|nr:hypothetical protein EDD99_0041 [Streptomyces sp. 846.5]